MYLCEHIFFIILFQSNLFRTFVLGKINICFGQSSLTLQNKAFEVLNNNTQKQCKCKQEKKACSKI